MSCPQFSYVARAARYQLPTTKTYRNHTFYISIHGARQQTVDGCRTVRGVENSNDTGSQRWQPSCDAIFPKPPRCLLFTGRHFRHVHQQAHDPRCISTCHREAFPQPSSDTLCSSHRLHGVLISPKALEYSKSITHYYTGAAIISGLPSHTRILTLSHCTR
jgi:hypothetical protein